MKVSFSIVCFSAACAFADIDVRFDVDIQKDLQPISPLIYGTNSDKLGAAEGVAFRRSGGNRLTG